MPTAIRDPDHPVRLRRSPSVTERQAVELPKVLQVITPSRMAGAEILLCRTIGRLRECGYQTPLAVSRKSPVAAELLQRCEGGELAPISGKLNARAPYALCRLAKKHNAAILHSHLSSASWWCGWAEKLGGPPSLGHVHGFTSYMWHRHQSRLVTCSHAVKEYLVEQGAESERIDVLHNPVDPSDVKVKTSPTTIREQLHTDDNSFVVGAFAHFSEKKGWHDFIQAALLVLEEDPQVTFWCVGDGPLRTELMRLIASHELADRFHFPGFRTDVADVMNAVDVMALPSHREPFGLVYVEAGLLGKPVIGCNAGGASEVIEHDETGLLVPPRDPDALAHALLTMIENRSWAASLGQCGQQSALQNFGWGRYLDQLGTIYASLC